MKISAFILLGVLALPALAIDSVFTPAGPEGPAQTAHAPEKGPGPIVILLSGASGPNWYQSFAGDVSRLGYYAVLLDGNDILTRRQDGAANLRKAIERAQESKHAIPGKAAVIGFSMGGGGALAHAVTGSLARAISLPVARRIAEKGGVIGIWPDGYTYGNLDLMADAVARIAGDLGPAHVGIGTDMNGLIRTVMPSYAEYAAMDEMLARRGMKAPEIEGILGGNYLRVLREAMKA